MNKIKFYRIMKGIPQKSLALTTGLSIGHLSHLENGDKQPSKSTMEAIADALQLTVPEVFYSPYTTEDFNSLNKLGYEVVQNGDCIEITKKGGAICGADNV